MMEKVSIEFELTPYKAFELLLKTLHVSIDEEIKRDAFIVEDGEIKVKDFDDRGELYMAIYHLATKLYPNTEFRGMFDNPNAFMAELYKKKWED